MESAFHTDLKIGASSVTSYARLNYTMWHALAEFIDNSTQSRENYAKVLNPVFKKEKSRLTVDISYDKTARQIVIEDNSIGMSKDDLVRALQIAVPTPDSKQRSRYGLGMKTAAFWIGDSWTVVTAEYGTGIEWTATVNVSSVAAGKKVHIKPREVSKALHYTRIIIKDLNRSIQARTEENIREYLGSMYRFDISAERLVLRFGDKEIMPPEEHDWDVDPDGIPYRRDIPPTKIGKHTVRGWVGVLKRGSGGRKFGGFSLFQHKRQIQGFPSAWKPRLIFGGVDDEGANNLVSQRLTGLVELDGFDVSHTKDAILFRDGEQEELEKLLADLTVDLRAYASARRGPKESAWTKEKVRDLINELQREFASPEMADAAAEPLPTLDAILAENQRRAAELKPDEEVAVIELLPGLALSVALQERSESDPYVTIVASSDPKKLHVIINNLHPYYAELETAEAREECLRQFVYDAAAEFRVMKQASRVNPDSARRKKDVLLRADGDRLANAAAEQRQLESDLISSDE